VREIKFYKNQSGKSPVEAFLNSLSAKQAQKVIWTLKLIAELETVPKQYFKKLTNTDDIWEVRIQFGGNIFRLLGFIEEEKLIILNHAFQKKTQKTPIKEIKLSEQRKSDYQSRK